MIIKKLGKSTLPLEVSADKTTNHNSKNKFFGNKIIYAGIILMAVGFIAYFFLFSNNNINSTYGDGSDKLTPEENLKRKELGLKEKELQLREKKIEVFDNKESLLNEKLYSWLHAIQNENDVSKYYADNVNYYSAGFIPLSKVLDDKKRFYKNWERRKFDADIISVNELGDDKYKIIYDKTFECDNLKENKFYNGKVKSVLVFINVGNEMLISEEYDDTIYYTNNY